MSSCVIYNRFVRIYTGNDIQYLERIAPNRPKNERYFEVCINKISIINAKICIYIDRPPHRFHGFPFCSYLYIYIYNNIRFLSKNRFTHAALD